MRFVNILSMGAATALLAGCGAYEVQQAKVTPTSPGPGFTQSLADQYKSLTGFQNDMQYDWPSAGRYGAKTLAAANGQDVAPDDPGGVPAAWAPQLADARARLLQALDFNNNRSAKPQLAAKAQAAYDCWHEEVVENWQTADIGTCRGAFENAVAELTQVAQTPPAPQPAPAPAAARTFYIYFDWDSATLTPEANQVVDQAAAAIKANASARIVVVGHADLSGPTSYNQRLSLRRADAVRTALVQRGVPTGQISASGVGESQPRVPTRKGVRDPQNRFVEIDIQ